MDGQGSAPSVHFHVESFTAKGHGAVPAGAFVVPDPNFIFHGEFKRAGVDLILSNDGRDFVVHDYFKGEKRASLASPDGAHLTGDLVNALAGNVQYAQAAPGAGAAQVIGHVTKLTGSATAIRNGVSIILNQGDNVEKGDVVSTGSDSTLGLTFIDGTVFGLSANARMVLNEMVYDPNGSNNSSLLSLVAGTITFVAGETAKHGEMKVDTPVATMGIRGTAVVTEISFIIPAATVDNPQPQPQPQANFQVLVEPDGHTGSYILFDKTTLLPIATVNQAGQMIQISGGNVTIGQALLSPEVQKLITDVFTLKFTDNSGNTKLTNNSTDSITQEGNKITVTTASGSSATATVTNTVNTTNNTQQQGPSDKTVAGDRIPGAPKAASLDLAGNPTQGFAIAERGGDTNTNDTADLDSVSGKVTFLDFNLGDTPTVKVNLTNPPVVTYKDAGQHDVTASLSALQKQDIAATEVKIVVVPASGNNNNGSAVWTYSVPDNLFDFLAAGETLTLNYVVRVDNNFAANNEFTEIPITIVITGTNDKPVITSSVSTIAFFGGTSVPGGPLTSGEPTSGTLSFTDVDLTDTHTVSVALTGASLPGGAVPPGPLAAFESAMSVWIANNNDSTGTGDGTINWSLADLPVYLADFIAKNQVLTLTYTVTVTDSQGATATQTITVAITGTDNPAVVWIATGSDAGGLWDDAANWETGTVPLAGDDVIVITDQLHGFAPSYPVTVDAAAVAHSVTMNDFDVSKPGHLRPELDNESTLTIGDTLTVKADAFVHNFAGAVITVGGEVTFGDGVNISKLTNEGTLTLAAGGSIDGLTDVTNSGLIDLSGGTLNLFADIANANGTIEVDTDATLNLSGATISGGTIDGAGTVDVIGASTIDGNATLSASLVIVDAQLTLDDVTVSGSVITDNSSVVLGDTVKLKDSAEIKGGPVTNNGTLEIAGAAALKNDAVTNNGTVKVDGGQTLTLDTTTITGGKLTIDGTLASTGASAINSADITNSGTIEVVSGTLTIDPAVQHIITNLNAIDVDGGALDLVNVEVDNSGTLTVAAGAELDLTSVEIYGGTLGNAGHLYALSGFNRVTAAVTNTGTLEVQSGTLDLAGGLAGAGALMIDNTATLELAGADAQTVTFAGGTDTLQLDDLAGQSFTGTIAGQSSSGGTFTVTGDANITSASGDALDFTASGGTGYNPANVVLTPAGTLTGAAGGIGVTHNGVGNVSITTAGAVAGLAGDGIDVIQDAAGASGSTHITNDGAVVGAAGFSAIHIRENATGTALIDNTGTIGPTDAGAITSSTSAIVETGGAVTINNTGEIDGNISVATATFNNESGGTWTVAGTSVFGAASLIDNGGQINLHDGAAISGSGLNITNSSAIDSWGTTSISGAIVNTGTIVVDSGALTLFGSLSGSGSVTIDEGATLKLEGSVSQTVTFAGDGSSELKIDTPTFGGSIAGLGAGDKIDLSSIHYDLATTSASYDTLTGDLTVTDLFGNAITLHLVGSDYSHAHFAGSDDGTGHTLITLNAADDAPNFASGEDAPSTGFAELAGTTGSSTTDPSPAATGTVHFTDVDLTDLPTASISDQSVTWTDANHVDISASLTQGEKDAIKQALTLQQSENQNGGAIGWTYSIADKALDFLGENQTVMLVSTVTLGDGYPGGTDTAQVTVTIHGTNDAPVIMAESHDQAGADLTETNAGQTAHGTLTVSDADVTDHVTVALDHVDVYLDGVLQAGPVGGLSNASLESYLTVQAGDILDGTATHAQFAWNFDSHGEAFDFLGVGQTLSLRYTIQPSDGHQQTGSGNAVVTINIAGTNDALVANDDVISSPTIYEDTDAALTTAQLLANDTDINPGVTLTVTSVGDLSGHSLHGGTVSLNGNAITYHSALNYNGPDSFTYTVSDGTVTSIGTVLFNVAAVDDAPVAVADTLSATEDTPITYTAAQLLGNDTDVDNSNGQLSIASVTSGVGGTAVLNPDGSVTFTPNADFNGAANFTYTVGDGASISNTATVTVNVAPVNDPPTGAVTISGLAQEGQTLTASNTLGDADGLGAIAYQWQRDGHDVAGATGTTYLLGNADVGHSIDVVATYVDGHGTAESVTSAATATVGNVNDPPTGTVTIAGLAREGQTLTASNTLGDADGLGAIVYQWQRDGHDVAGATGTTYLLGNADVGHSIDVVATYVDGHGTAESVTSAATATIGNVNDPPTGSVTIAGLAQEGQTLTASNTLGDADGLGAIAYQWQRDGHDVAGATGTTYLLGNADVGHSIDVVAKYVDGHGTAESVTSAATATVGNVNDPPTGSVTISGLAQEGQTLTASNTLGDADGLGTIAYQWQRDGHDVAGATGTTYLLGNADVGHAIDVVAKYVDGHGTAESVTSAATATVGNVNDPPTGSVTISGLAQEGQTLTASNTLGDADGLGAIAYQWQRDGHDVAGATGTTYLLGNADVGHSIDVVATYVDGHGTAESVTSAATATVGNVNDPPTGSVTIAGLAQEGQTLTASNTLGDADGLGAIAYQWQR
ncbi:tandem-95 repeat protein, partial [Bradyrhizobium sp.]|uniref:tandem-95 repeat protein n=1 Tax=Bradyrhizobium sp. TaxID=376 RepID=UPI002624194C